MLSPVTALKYLGFWTFNLCVVVVLFPAPKPKAQTIVPSPSPVATAQQQPKFTPEQIDYFKEVAFGSEFGKQTNAIRKWQQPIRLEIKGTPTKDDRSTLDQVIKELRELSGQEITIVPADGNAEIHFVKPSQFKRIEPNYQPLNSGFAWVWWNDRFEITRARILISATIGQAERDSVIREELTQSLGLLADSERYPDSIFYQGYNQVAQFSAQDAAVIKMLRYVKPGMRKQEIVQ